VYFIEDKDESNYIQKELIEDSSDWILQPEEKDWIDEVIKYLTNQTNAKLDWGREEQVSKAIESHMPKITEEDLDNAPLVFAANHWKRCILAEDLIPLLKEKNLYKE